MAEFSIAVGITAIVISAGALLSWAAIAIARRVSKGKEK